MIGGKQGMRLKTVINLLPLISSDVASERALAVAGISVSLGLIYKHFQAKILDFLQKNGKLYLSEPTSINELVCLLSDMKASTTSTNQEEASSNLKIKYLYWMSPEKKEKRASLSRINKYIDDETLDEIPDPRVHKIWIINDWNEDTIMSSKKKLLICDKISTRAVRPVSISNYRRPRESSLTNDRNEERALSKQGQQLQFRIKRNSKSSKQKTGFSDDSHRLNPRTNIGDEVKFSHNFGSPLKRRRELLQCISPANGQEYSSNDSICSPSNIKQIR